MRVALALVMVAVLSSVAYADGAIVVLVDRTMSSDKIATVTHSLTENLQKFDPHDEIAIVSYAKSARIDLPLQSVSHRAHVSSAVSKITTATESDINAGLRTASTLFARTKRTDRFLLVITDAPTVNVENPIVRQLWKQNVHVSALSYQSSNSSTLDTITQNDGRAYSIKRAKDLGRVFAKINKANPPRSLAAVLVIDRSDSMTGQPLEIAKEAARATVEVLSIDSMVAVVAFDMEAQVFVRPQNVSNRMRISTDISRLTPGGGTNTFAGLQQAFEILENIDADQKVVVFFSDGDGPEDGVADLVDKMRTADITVSTVGVGHADRKLLSMIADHGDGRLYMTEDIGSLPRIFMRETWP